jgi:hypothetical protein
MVARSTLCFLVGSLALPLACGSDEGPPPPPPGGGQVENGDVPAPTLVCPAYGDAQADSEMAPLEVAKAQAVGAIDGSFSISSAGSAHYSISLTLPPARRVPSLGIVFDTNAGSGILGKGVAISGLSSIHRCGSNLAQDNQVRGVKLDTTDHFCINGTRLIQTGIGKDSVGTFAEYRTMPDSFTRILGYGAPGAGGFVPTYFVGYFSDGNIVQYGKSINARVFWRGGVVREWQKELDIDRRGNTIRYKYAVTHVDGKSGTTMESVIDTITYAGFIDTNGVETLGNAVVDFEYDDDERHGKLFYEGDEVSRRMRLAKIVTRKNSAIVLSYSFTYGEDSATNTGLVEKIEECAKDDATQCKPATSFDWQMGDKGFASHVANVPVPVKSEDDRFSWTIADVSGDGSPDIVTSTTHPDSGVNRWFVYENVGSGSFLSPVEWFTAPFPQGFHKQWQITPVDENGDGRIDLLIDQPDGAAWNTLRVLRSIAEPSPHFELIATSIPRTSQHRASEFTVDSHSGVTVADVDADGMNDVITCRDLRTHYGKAEYVPDNCDADEECKPSLARWSAHLWRPNGFESTERHIAALDGVSCWTMKRFFGAVDWNADGQTDLVTASKNGMLQVHTLDLPSLKWESTELSMALANVLGVEVWNDPVANMVGFPLTANRAQQMESQWEPLRALFPDLNADGYPDLLYMGRRGTTVKPLVVINEGRDEYTGFLHPYDAVGANSQTFYYSSFARVFDYSGDGRDDLMLPVGGSCPGEEEEGKTCYVVFESGRVGEDAKIIKTSIPFENPDGESVAPQYLLRTADVNADSSVDIVHPTASGQMTIFVNQSKPNLLASITTGRNPLDKNDAGYLPDVSFTYGNLVDHSARTPSWEHDSLTYIARADSANGCDYPRACVVGGKPVVASYTLNNGQNQPRNFAMFYQDGRVDRHGRGFLGFANVETRDLDTGSVTRQRFDNMTFDPTFKTFPFAGKPFETRTTMPVDGVVLESSTSIVPEVHATNGGMTYFVATQSTQKATQTRCRHIGVVMEYHRQCGRLWPRSSMAFGHRKRGRFHDIESRH